MWRCKRVEIDRGHVVEELPLVKNPDDIATDKATQAITSYRKFSHFATFILQCFDLFGYLSDVILGE